VRGKVIWQRGVKGQLFFNGEVEEQFFFRVEWPNGQVERGVLYRRIWWERGLKCVEHWCEFPDEENKR